MQSRKPFPNLYFGWYIVAAGWGMQILMGALMFQAYGSYAAVMREEFGWSKTMFSAAFSMSQAESAVLGPVQGRLIDRFGPRIVSQIGVVIFGGGFMLFSQVESQWSFFAAFFVVALGAALTGFMSFTIAIVNWFERRRSTALGIMLTGLAVGGLIVPAVVVSLEQFGWRDTAFGSGVIIIAVGLPLTLVLRHRPEQYGYEVDGMSLEERDAQRRVPLATHEFTAREALRTPAFWFLSLGHASALLVVSAVLVHMVLHVNENLGYSLGTAGAITALLTASMIVGLLGGGGFGDRVSKRALIVGCMAGHTSGLLLLAYATNLWMVALFAILHGTAWGTRAPVLQSIRADYFGRAAFGTITGLSTFISLLGMMAGPIVAGVLADKTGGYELGFTLLAIVAGVGAIFFFFARPPKPPVRRVGSSDEEYQGLPAINERNLAT